MSSSTLSIAAVLALLTVASAASADLPGPKPRCDVEGHGCTECRRSYGSDPPSQEAFKTCADSAKAKGLVEACAHHQGAGDATFFCPAGTKIKTKVVGGCAVSGEGTTAAPAAVALGRTRRGGGRAASAMRPGE